MHPMCKICPASAVCVGTMRQRYNVTIHGLPRVTFLGDIRRVHFECRPPTLPGRQPEKRVFTVPIQDAINAGVVRPAAAPNMVHYVGDQTTTTSSW